MIRPILFSLAALLSAAPALAQSVSFGGRQCATPSPSFETRMESAAAVSRWRSMPGAALRAMGGTVTIPVAVHVVSAGDSPSQGNVPDAWIRAQVDVLNAAFEPMGYRFALVYVGRVRNADWYTGLSFGSTVETQMKQTLALDPARFLNIYTVDVVSGLLGWATFPEAGGEDDLDQGVVIDAQTLPGGNASPYNEGDTGTHEVGHWVGLYHTFESTCGETNCQTQGDGVCDTPTQSGSTSGCPEGRNSCPEPAGEAPVLDPIHNFMDYSTDLCMTEFTAGQVARANALMAEFRPTIVQAASAFVAPEALAFGDLFVGQRETQTVTVVNLTAEPLEVTSVSSDDPDLTSSVASLTVAAQSSASFTVTYAPDSEAPLTATLRLTTSNASVGTITVPATGSGRQPPALGVERPALSASLAPGEETTQTLTLTNTGPGRLTFTVPGAEESAGLAGRQPAAPDAEAPPAPTAKGAEDPRLGARVASGIGGPDAAGYTWIDSREADGPVYDWIDISTTGTPLELADDEAAAVSLPFAFPFYGGSFSSVRVVSNGYLTFSTASLGDFAGSQNEAIPRTSVPNLVVAPYWDDLDPSEGGVVRYQTLPDGRFVVSWIEVPHYQDARKAPGSFTFQVVLSPDGALLYQYHRVRPGDYAGQATVGIENGDGTVGLQVAFNTAYVEENLAVQIARRPAWVEAVTPASGTVLPGGEQPLAVTLSADGLSDGVYQDLLTILTNDPLVPSLRVHTVLAVGGALPPPALTAPRFGLVDVPTDVALDWLPVDGARGYRIQVAGDRAFANPQILFVSEPSDGGPVTSATFAASPNTTYYWRVLSCRAASTFECTGDAASPYSTPFVFTTGAVVVASEGAGVGTGALRLGAPFPNPARGPFSIPFHLDRPGPVTLSVLDVTGRTVAVVTQDEPYPSGDHVRQWPAAEFPSGVYIVRLETEGGTASTRIAVVR